MTVELLDRWDERPVAELAAEWGVPLLEAYRVIGSTNDRAAAVIVARARGALGLGPAAERREWAPSGVGAIAPPANAVPWAVVLADEQSSGRGRRGAFWYSPPGCGVWMSAVLPGRWSETPHLPLLVGLAVAEAIEAVAPGARVGLEWPNDLRLGGAKVGGILCEAWRGGVAVGVGVNLRTPPGGYPAGLAAVATSLEDACAISLSRRDLACHIVKRLRAYFQRAESIPTTAWLEELARRDTLAGQAVETEQEGAGVAAGIGEDGALLLQREDGATVRVVAGGVRLR